SDADPARTVAGLAVAVLRAGLVVAAATTAEIGTSAVRSRLRTVADPVLTGDADASSAGAPCAVVVALTGVAVRAALATRITAAAVDIGLGPIALVVLTQGRGSAAAEGADAAVTIGGVDAG